MRFGQQAAMEYLMTYGWAILIVAIVIVALFQLGMFNNSNLTPHATAGACQLVHSAAGSSLAGQCNNEIPQSVAQFNGASSSTVSATVPQLNTNAGSYDTVSFWMYWNGQTNQMPFGFGSYDLWFNSATCFGFNTASGDDYGLNPSGFPNRWVFVTSIFYNGAYTGHNLIYINGVQQTLSQCSASPSSGYATTNVHISGWGNGGYYFSGALSNIQIYNTSLSAGEISMLYTEGIGGAPVDPTHIAGWWPLNGNAQDYSGNSHNGQLTGISWNGTWTSGYTAP